MIFNYTITSKNDITILNLNGDLIDKNQAIDLIDSITKLLENGKNKLIINLENLKYMNSSGLNVLIQVLTKTRTNGGESIIYNVNSKINELLIITKLNTLFKVVDTEIEALNLLV